jgi:hypothetical protein
MLRGILFGFVSVNPGDRAFWAFVTCPHASDSVLAKVKKNDGNTLKLPLGRCVFALQISSLTYPTSRQIA